MRRALIWMMPLAVLAISGCQTTSPTYTGACTDRPDDAGFCDQPNNWMLFGPKTGPFFGIGGL
ncbi:hypothetical protein [Pseudaminobacter sp. NGMCC 1.201702]|jgi:hypothetical protein|uniref:hypothetical protein n=1 Tax=Pseudaminobacter sp. NGMCC 1.201702 TaxID=3391825 RepID=UPI0039EFB099